MAYLISGAIVVVSLVAIAIYAAYKEDRLIGEIYRRLQELEGGWDDEKENGEEKEKVDEKAE